jgi:hypothetical protein
MTGNDQNPVNKMKDVVLQEIAEIPVSLTQKYRVLIVLDEVTQKPKVSAQRWWRRSIEDEWVAGKGFKLDEKQSLELGSLIIQGGKVLGEHYSK